MCISILCENRTQSKLFHGSFKPEKIFGNKFLKKIKIFFITELFSFLIKNEKYAFERSIYTYKTWILSVCMSVCPRFFSATKSPSFMKMWLKASFGPGWSMTKPDFRYFHYITLLFFLFHATGQSFSPRNVIFGLREPWTIRNWRLLIFFGNSFFYG